ncbi:MAG TPA: hypothetical protein VH740_27255 [Vicinamibacterales bacterium]
MKRSAFAIVVFGLLAVRTEAQQRPLVTEDPETVGTGNVLLEAGFDSQRDVFYPASGLRGDLLRVPTIGVSFGFSSILELQIDGGFYNRLNITSIDPAPLSDKLELTGDRTTDIEDVVVATKIRLVTEAAGRPSIGIRFATKLPLAGNESGLGLDTIDFHMTGLFGKTVQSVRVVGNVGLGILSDPVEGDRQNDVITYGLSVARALRQGAEFVGEINGRLNTRNERVPPGTESRSALRVGLRYTRATVRVDGGLMFGVTSGDPNFGFTGGVTYVFRGFTLP